MLDRKRPEPPGTVTVTPGFYLPMKYVLHAVGLVIPDHKPSLLQQEQLVKLLPQLHRACRRIGLQPRRFLLHFDGCFRLLQQDAAALSLLAIAETLGQLADRAIRTRTKPTTAKRFARQNRLRYEPGRLRRNGATGSSRLDPDQRRRSMSVDKGSDSNDSVDFLKSYPYLRYIGVHRRYHSIGFPWSSKAIQWAGTCRDVLHSPPPPSPLLLSKTTG